ncbi:MAG: linear amide C-N hydrolase [Clostridium fessum]
MCTANYKTKGFYFGRTLDYEFSDGGDTITPAITRSCSAIWVRLHPTMPSSAWRADNYPLYYDAMNEKGLGMADSTLSETPPMRADG